MEDKRQDIIGSFGTARTSWADIYRLGSILWRYAMAKAEDASG